MNKVVVLKEGYSKTSELGEQKADGSITLVKANGMNILVDTGLPNDKDFICSALAGEGLTTDGISVVVGTHGHSDHIGNLGLFPNSLIVVGYDICRGDTYLNNGLKQGLPYPLSSDIEVKPTPGHTGNDVSLLVRNTSLGTVVVAGDLFESEADIADDALWREVSENPSVQFHNRLEILRLADFIVPGHGPMFKVTEKHRTHLEGQSELSDSP